MGKGRKHVFMGWVTIVFCCTVFADCTINNHSDRSIPERDEDSFSVIKLHRSRHHVDLNNGIVKLTLTNPTGHITGVAYKGVDNVLEYRHKQTQRGYWDIMWSRPERGTSILDKIEATSFKVVAQTADQIEVSFTSRWNFSLGENVVPLNIDKRYIMLRGVSGFYSYAIFEHLKGWPDLNIDEARIVFKLHQDMFHYMAISDNIQRIMPTDKDRKTGLILNYKEAVLLTNPSNPILKGQVDDKYQYSCDNKDSHVHGWISSDPHVGFWVITPSDEFRAGGPMKPDLTSHTGATSLAVFFSDHYAGPAFGIRLRNGEYWEKVFGPIFVYLNEDSGILPSNLWQDAQKQMSIETKKWPYDFPLSKDFPRANQRGSIRGRLLVHDRYISKDFMPAKSAYVGVAPPGNEGSWQDDAKGYQFWARSDENGYFIVRGIRAGTYNLYAWVPGFIGDFKHDKNIIIRPGSEIQIGNILYEPPRDGPTMWEIGVPDRTAAEFYVPDPSPRFTTKLLIHHTDESRFRQYGLWDRYTDLYPEQDLIYTVGVSIYMKDWFFAHVNRKVSNNKYIPATWQILFDVRNVVETGDYTLRIALASATMAEVQVRINDPNTRRPDFTTGRIGRDNAIARHGIHGKYWLYSVNISGFLLVSGRNVVYLKQARALNPFIGVMYDYIRLEAPGDDRWGQSD